MSETTTITISEKNWKRLSNLKINNKKIKYFDDAIDFLFENCKEVKNDK